MRSIHSKKSSLLRTACLSIAIAASSHAAIILNSNLDGTLNSNVGSFSGKAVGFTLGTTAALGAPGYQLENIVVRLEVGAAAPLPENYQFRLYSNDGSNSPGTQLLQFTSITLATNTVDNYTFTPAVPFVLQPSTTYWLVATAPMEPGFTWKYGGPASTTTAAGVSTSSPLSYFGSGDPGTWTSTSPNFTDLQINAVAVPEASVLSLVALVVPFALRRRRCH